AAKRDRARRDDEHVALLGMQRRDVARERDEPVLVHAPGRGVDQERGADLDDDAAKVSELRRSCHQGRQPSTSAGCGGSTARAPSITSSNARRISGTPWRDTPESTSGVFFAARLSRATCSLSCSGESASALLSATISTLSVTPWPYDSSSCRTVL